MALHTSPYRLDGARPLHNDGAARKAQSDSTNTYPLLTRKIIKDNIRGISRPLPQKAVDSFCMAAGLLTRLWLCSSP